MKNIKANNELSKLNINNIGNIIMKASCPHLHNTSNKIIIKLMMTKPKDIQTNIIEAKENFLIFFIRTSKSSKAPFAKKD